MRTVFDLTGKFMRLGADRMVRGEKRILVYGLTPSQAAFGKTRLEQLAMEKAKELIEPGHFWFKDWELVERKVKDEVSNGARERDDESIHSKHQEKAA